MSYCHLGRPLIPCYFKSSKKHLILNPPIKPSFRSQEIIISDPQENLKKPCSNPKKPYWKTPQKTLFQSQIANPKNWNSKCKTILKQHGIKKKKTLRWILTIVQGQDLEMPISIAQLLHCIKTYNKEKINLIPKLKTKHDYKKLEIWHNARNWKFYLKRFLQLEEPNFTN